MGYSFGSLVTIELARQLEAKGFNGRLILIDGAPQLMKEIISQYFKSSSKEELQNDFLVGIAESFTSANSKEVRPFFLFLFLAVVIPIFEPYFTVCIRIEKIQNLG